MEEAYSIREFSLGDFYPLLSFSLAPDAWAAWQFDRPDLGQGMVVAFRRDAAPFACFQPRLHALDPGAEYDLRSWDEGQVERMSGRELMAGGLAVRIDEAPGSRLYTYTLAA